MKTNIYIRFIIKAAAIFATFLIIAIIPKPLFLAIHSATASFSDALDVIVNGADVDCTIAGYLTIIPIILSAAATWIPTDRRRIVALATTTYFIIAAILISAAYTLNIGLYAHWGFPLDATPIFYFTSSPQAALASVTATEAAIGTAFFLIFGAAAFFLLRCADKLTGEIPNPHSSKKKAALTAVAALTLAVLFIPIRGGVTVSTMNPGRAYYSDDKILNHSAANPVFTLIYSLSHQNDFASQFKYMDTDKAEKLFASIARSSGHAPGDSIIATQRPDVYIIILESFSSHLLPSAGGESIAVRLDSIARDGVLFTNLYASSFRTDRALPAILSGFPAQPNTSILKFSDKIESLPSLPMALREAGWQTSYYYGGDADFTNMMVYLVTCGFSKIVSDKDFPLAKRTGKWGAHDHDLFEKCLADIHATPADAPPQLRVIQTSSSHEPFEVPYKSALKNPAAKAFAYTDSCAASFIDALRDSPRYARSLFVLVPDHYGAYPKGLSDEKAKHHIPLIFAGGALAKRGFTVEKIASQTDIAATLLDMLGIDSGKFVFSNNIFAAARNDFAFFSSPSAVTFVSPKGTTTLDIDSGKITGPDAMLLKAYIQKLYATLAEM